MGTPRYPLDAKTLERIWRGDALFYPGGELAKDSGWDSCYSHDWREAMVGSPPGATRMHVALLDAGLRVWGGFMNKEEAERKVSRWLLQGIL